MFLITIGNKQISLSITFCQLKSKNQKKFKQKSEFCIRFDRISNNRGAKCLYPVVKGPHCIDLQFKDIAAAPQLKGGSAICPKFYFLVSVHVQLYIDKSSIFVCFVFKYFFYLIVWKVMEMCFQILVQEKRVTQRELFYKLLCDSPDYFTSQLQVNRTIQGLFSDSSSFSYILIQLLFLSYSVNV